MCLIEKPRMKLSRSRSRAHLPRSQRHFFAIDSEGGRRNKLRSRSALVENRTLLLFKQLETSSKPSTPRDRYKRRGDFLTPKSTEVSQKRSPSFSWKYPRQFCVRDETHPQGTVCPWSTTFFSIREPEARCSVADSIAGPASGNAHPSGICRDQVT